MSLEGFILALLGSWLAVTIFLSLVRVRGVECRPFLLVVRGRPRALGRLLDAMSSRWGGLWATLMDVGVAMGLGMMAFSTYFLAANLARRFLVPGEFVAVMPPIPGVFFPLDVLPHFIAALALAIAVHEAAHAIASRALGVEVRGVGVAVALIVLAAFVELDEEGVRRMGVRDKLRVLLAGSAANMLLFLLVVACFTLLFQPGGVLVQRVEPGTPADEAGIARCSVIVALNGSRVLDSVDLHRFMAGTRPNQTVVVELIEPSGSREVKVLRTASHPLNRSRGFLGVLPADYYALRVGWLPPATLVQVYTFTLWLEVLLFSLAVFNMLPISVADGGRALRAIAEEAFRGDEGKVKALSLIANLACIGLIAANVALTIL